MPLHAAGAPVYGSGVMTRTDRSTFKLYWRRWFIPAA